MNLKKQKTKKEPVNSSTRLYGTATVGTKGQIVIPIEARKKLEINPGDQLLILGNEDTRVIAIIKTEEISRFIKDISSLEPL
jgi:AbrB family looped-hinge helix DNA binding protein